MSNLFELDQVVYEKKCEKFTDGKTDGRQQTSGDQESSPELSVQIS